MLSSEVSVTGQSDDWLVTNKTKKNNNKEKLSPSMVHSAIQTANKNTTVQQLYKGNSVIVNWFSYTANILRTLPFGPDTF